MINDDREEGGDIGRAIGNVNYLAADENAIVVVCVDPSSV